MTAWTNDQLARIGPTGELEIAGRREDGTVRKPRIVWVVRLGDSLYVRSVNGPDAVWYRGVRTSMQGHIKAGGVDEDITVVDVDHALDDALDAYRTKPGASESGVRSNQLSERRFRSLYEPCSPAALHEPRRSIGAATGGRPRRPARRRAA
jgi:hypothetical protein